MPVDTEVLIVGAGPTGLTLASELIRRGISCEIIDALAGPSDKSRALAIHARTLEILEQMGLIDSFLAVGWKSHAFTVYDKTNQIARMTFAELDCSFPYVMSLRQSDTEKFLADSLRASNNQIQWNTSLVSFVQEADRVEATIRETDSAPSGTAEGAAGDGVKLSCRWLVGCDGAHSTVRKLLNAPFQGLPYWEQYVLADVDFETSLDTGDHYLFSGKDGIAGFHPFSPNCARIFVDIGKIDRPSITSDHLPEDRKLFPEPTQQELQKFLDERGPGTVQLKKINWLSMHTVHRRQVQSYRHGRVFLAGDAAHLHSPTSGQGMNLGIQDAYNLAWKLALVERKAAPELLLDSYSSERWLIGRRVSTMSDLFSRINELRSPITQLIRNKIGPILATQEGIRNRYRNAVAGLSSNYRLSPVVDQYVQLKSLLPNGKGNAISRADGDEISWDSAPASGDRTPDGTVLGTTGNASYRLFDLLKSTEHQLLLFAGQLTEEGKLKELIEIANFTVTCYGSIVKPLMIVESKDTMSGLSYKGKKYRDPDLSLHRRYGAKVACFFLIRPDGYVAFRSMPANKKALANYLQSVFA